MFEREKSSSTLENVFFGVAFVLFLVVGFFAAKRFGLLPGRPSEAPAWTNVPPPQPGVVRIGIDDHPTGREIVGRESGPVVTNAPPLKGARSHRRKKTVVPDLK